MAPLILKINHPIILNKMASFDYDWTLVQPKDSKTFPTSVDDWVWLYPNVPEKLIQYHKDGYMIVIFTNQSKDWKCNQIVKAMETIGIPMFIVIARNKPEYKPNKILFSTLVKDKPIDLHNSFFVGDALGRKTDFSDSDKLFALNIGIPYFSPESIFTESKDAFIVPDIPTGINPEIIIMVGYPGSGKTTIAKKICLDKNYVYISGDIYKTSSKMRKASLESISQRKSIVFDATHGSIKKRKEYIDFAEKNNYKVRCIHVDTTLEESYRRNKLRSEDKQVPRIAYSVYKKYYQEPTEEEGFVYIKI